MGHTQTNTQGVGDEQKGAWWEKDEKEHFALGSHVFVVMPGLPPVLCHDSCPPIQSSQSSISTQPWLGFKPQQHTLLTRRRQRRF